MLLAIDTSTSAITVALLDQGQVLAESSVVDARAHGELVAPGIAAVLDQAGVTAQDVTAVVAGRGPGPFTGLRVGLVTARVFALARSLPLHGLCSLDALAFAAVVDGRVGGGAGAGADGAGAGAAAEPEEFLVATDARRKEVYVASYRATGDERVVEALTAPAVSTPAELAEVRAGRPVVGRGAELYPDLLGPTVGPLDVSAAALGRLATLRLGAGEDLSDTTALYLRRPDALTTAERLARAADKAAR